MAGEASHVSKEWYGKVVDFEAIIQTQYTLIEGMQDTLYMKAAVRTMINDSLNDLIAECETIINDSTGQLDGNVNTNNTDNTNDD